MTARRPLARWSWRIALVYGVLLLLSHGVRALRRTDPPLGPGVAAAEVKAVEGERTVDGAVRIAYREYGPREAPALLLLHGSPGDGRDVLSLVPRLADRYRVIVPDLPGFGSSTRTIPDYSFRAHARYLVELMDALGVDRAHVVAFSMGGGVALSLADIAPERVRSLAMLSTIGIQQMELLGEYYVNHLLHGIQLGALSLVIEGVPHFGLLGDTALSYARNFYDSDQRPLGAILSRYEGPMLIVHGRRDVLAPVEVAIESARLVPQSELDLVDGNHFMVFGDGASLAERVARFLERVEKGVAATRATAPAGRLAEAARPFDPASLPKFEGVAALVVIALLAVATFASEDLTCVTAGVLAAQGRIRPGLAIFACMLGIYLGDMQLFVYGRLLGRRILDRAPLRWFLRERDVERCSRWLRERGATVVFLSRFLPGTRLPTYFAAGILDTSAWRFSLYFLLAVVVWTPMLVGLSMLLGREVLEAALMVNSSAAVAVVAAIAAGYFILRLGLALSSLRGRRLLVARLRRLARWEFWPPWIFYPPVVAFVGWLALEHRSLTLFTAANPAIVDGGFVGESKSAILEGLAGAGERVARWARVDAALEPAARAMQVESFRMNHGLGYPVVLKPDVGQRGAGVAIVRSAEEEARILKESPFDLIVQEYVPGVEFGVFYYRFPGESRGRVSSITDKRFPYVTGDGRGTLEELILRDERAVLMARAYFERHAENLWRVPGEGEVVRLVEIGTHCRGALFLDGDQARTDALEAAIDEISRCFDGFFFGRFDVRAPSTEEFMAGRGIRVLELNGVTSEATHIYDPKHGLARAYRVLFEQWRVAFAIGAANRALGATPTPVGVLVRRIAAFLAATPARTEATGPSVARAAVLEEAP